MPEPPSLSRPRALTIDEQSSFTSARYLATRLQSYLSSALFALSPLMLGGLGTFAVDRRWRLYMDPTTLRDWSTEECAAVLLHEVGHLVRDHGRRGTEVACFDTASQLLWNIAGDMAINDDLVADRLQLPGQPVTPSACGFSSGLLEEEYFRLLRTRSSNDSGLAFGLDDDTVDRSDGRANDRDDHPGIDHDLDAEGRHHVHASPDCGSGADGRRRPWEVDDDFGVDGVSPAAARSIRHQVANTIRSRGNVPAGWRRWAEDLTDIHPDWRRILRAALIRPRSWTAGRLERTWTRPDRRAGSHSGFLFPGVRSPRFEIAVIIDTSASMSDAELGAALGEVTAVQRQCGVKDLWVIPCDAEPGEPQRVRNTATVSLCGGGGTDLRPAIALLGGLRPRPDVAVVITDGGTPWPARLPKGTALVVATTGTPCPLPGVVNVDIQIAV